MISLGTDPELVGIARDAEKLRAMGVDPRMVNLPIPGYFGLPVKDPLHPDIELPFGQLRPDGMAFEFTVHPTDDVTEMVRRIKENIKATAQLAYDKSGAELSVAPKFHTDLYWIERLPVSYGSACSLQELGCAPDFNAYELDVPAKPDPRVCTYRTSGGHIHFGNLGQMAEDDAAVTFISAALDALIGTAGTYLCTSTEAYERKHMYGQAGMLRTKPDKGLLEYRTLPAQALVQTPDLARMMFTAGQSVLSWMHDVYTSMDQLSAIRLFRTHIGNFDQMCDTASHINSHTVDECRKIQARIAARLSSFVNIEHVVNEMQAYTMPVDFALHNWE